MNGQTAAAERGHLYMLLSAVFRRPLDAEQLKRLRAPGMLAAMSAAGVDPGDELVGEDAKAILDRLAIDYTWLFHDPGGHIAPYESIQTGESAELMGAAAHRVRRFMADVGFKVPPETGELPDHISVELAFMGALAHREADAIGAGDPERAALASSLQRKFHAEHLGRWAERFAGKVRERAKTPFYAAMADLLSGFVAEGHSAEAA